MTVNTSALPRFVPLAWLFAASLLPIQGSAAEGQALYEATCVACHGPTGLGAIPGVPNLAPRMAKTDAELVRNILEGFQTAGSPLAMPAKGGNANLSVGDAQALVGYLRRVTATPTPSTATPPAAASPPIPAGADAPAGATATPASPDVAAFARGAQAWADNCARCHAMRDPKSLSDAQWKVAVNHMRLRAGLDGRVTRDITDFLQASN